MSASQQPKGFRDVYWCWIVNEPEFMRYADDGLTKLCGACEGVLDEMPDQHTFAVHVTKPVVQP